MKNLLIIILIIYGIMALLDAAYHSFIVYQVKHLTQSEIEKYKIDKKLSEFIQKKPHVAYFNCIIGGIFWILKLFR